MLICLWGKLSLFSSKKPFYGIHLQTFIDTSTVGYHLLPRDYMNLRCTGFVGFVEYFHPPPIFTALLLLCFQDGSHHDEKGFYAAAGPFPEARIGCCVC